MTRTSRPVVSPDGKWILYSVSEPNYDPAKASSDLWIVAPDGTGTTAAADRRRATRSRAPPGRPIHRRSPSAPRREGDTRRTDLRDRPVAAGEARRITASATGASSPRWRPDGKAILFESPVRSGPPPDKSTARAFDAMPVRYWNTWLDGAKPHVFVQEIDGLRWTGSPALDSPRSRGSTASSAATAPTRTLQAVWAPDGQEIVFAAATNRDAMMREGVSAALYRVRLGARAGCGDAERRVVHRAGFSPDGRVADGQDRRRTPWGRSSTT